MLLSRVHPAPTNQSPHPTNRPTDPLIHSYIRSGGAYPAHTQLTHSPGLLRLLICYPKKLSLAKYLGSLSMLQYNIISWVSIGQSCFLLRLTIKLKLIANHWY